MQGVWSALFPQAAIARGRGARQTFPPRSPFTPAPGLRSPSHEALEPEQAGRGPRLRASIRVPRQRRDAALLLRSPRPPGISPSCPLGSAGLHGRHRPSTRGAQLASVEHEDVAQKPPNVPLWVPAGVGGQERPGTRWNTCPASLGAWLRDHQVPANAEAGFQSTAVGGGSRKPSGCRQKLCF